MNTIDLKIQELEQRIAALKAQKINNKIVPFEDISWEAVYDRLVEYATDFMSDDARDADSSYLYEEMLKTVCPTIFK